jgi:probable phosphoglycerate mutase
MAGRMPGVHLSDQGKAEAERTAERLNVIPFAAIYASPLERTQETAEPLARRQNLNIHVSDALNEVNFGQWTGMNFDLLHNNDQWKLWNASRSCSRPPGGEMLVEIQARMVDKIEVLREAYVDKHVALFTHSDTIRASLAFYLGIPVDMCVRIAVDPASVSVLRFYGTKPEVARVNDTGEYGSLITQ